MNERHFACADCKVFVAAGYRWAYWELEQPGIVSRGEAVSVDAILAAERYWNPEPEGSAWLFDEVFPSVRRLFAEHEGHRIIYGEEEDFLSVDDGSFLEWKQLWFLLDPLPRYLVEDLGFTTWGQVCKYMEQQQRLPWWWKLEQDDIHSKARKKFEEIVHNR